MGILTRATALFADAYYTTVHTLPDTVFAARDTAEYLTNQFTVDDQHLKDAQATLDSILPINRIEQCSKSVTKIIVQSLKREFDNTDTINVIGLARNLTSAELDTIEFYALKCPLEYGLDVYTARSIMMQQNDSLFEYYSDYRADCDTSGGGSSSARMAQLPPNKTTVAVYPNPTTGTLFIQLAEGMENCKMQLISVTGSVLHTYNIPSTLTELNLATLANGMYFIRIFDSSGNTIENRKISLQR